MMPLGEGDEKAPYGLRLDFVTQCGAASIRSNGMRRLPQYRRPFDKVAVGIHYRTNLGRETKADENGNRLLEQIGFHRALLSNRV
ncbi:hypothetical protein N184_34475 [Sinorhizobium sp. GL28]|nr:hypothetical protein N184_34475 [Sinorhizobium sp. GL28]